MSNSIAINIWEKAQGVTNLIKYHLWHLAVIFFFLSWVIVYLLKVNNAFIGETITPIPSILATTLSLFFTVPFITATLMKRGFIDILKLTNGNKFHFVFLSHLVGIAFPLLALKSGINILEKFGVENDQITNISITTSVSLMIFCILIILAYLQDLRRYMRFAAIPILTQEALDAIEKLHEKDAINTIADLESLGEDFASERI